jgi:hypothetical protein
MVGIPTPKALLGRGNAAGTACHCQSFATELAMLHTIVSAAAAFAAMLALTPFAAAEQAGGETRISGPVVHENLAVYLIHGPSRDGPVPLTLQEALEARRVEVRETGQVNTLEVENVGDDAVFVQSGDIVKGGRQDRVLMVSLILPPHSGVIPIASFCVEQGRWSERAGEDASKFNSAAAALPSRVGKLALAGASATGAARASGAGGPGDRVAGRERNPRGEPTQARQQQVWREVDAIQQKLTRSLAAPVAAAKSRTSLQLSLENDKLREAEAAYVQALAPAGEGDADVVGYAIAVNGKVMSADVYPSNGLFRKLWRKQLRAAIAEAIGERQGQTAPAPAPDAVQAFLRDGENAAAERKVPTPRGSVDMRENERVLFQEARSAPAKAGAAPAAPWAHRNYLAK